LRYHVSFRTTASLLECEGPYRTLRPQDARSAV